MQQHGSRLKSIVLGLLGTAALAFPADAAHWLSFDAPNSWITAPTGINGHNVIVGIGVDLTDTSHAFFRTGDGTITMFDAPDATDGTSAACVNERGDIAGSYTVFDNGQQYLYGFVRHPDGTFEEFGVAGSRWVNPLDINRKDTVVGYVSTDASSEIAFLRRAGGVAKLFLVNNEASSAVSINDSGEIVGSYQHQNVWHGYIREPGGRAIPFDPPGSTATWPGKINDNGEIAGTYVTADNLSHGFLREPDGAFTTFDIVGAANGPGVSGFDSDGDIAGYYEDANFYDHGFVRDRAGNIHLLDVPGETSTYISAMSPNGKLVGHDFAEHGIRAYPSIWRRN